VERRTLCQAGRSLSTVSHAQSQGQKCNMAEESMVSQHLFHGAHDPGKVKGTITEIIYSPQLDRSRFFLTGLYNKIDSDLYKYETATLSGTFLVARNLRLIAEYTRDLENELNRFTLGLVSGF